MKALPTNTTLEQMSEPVKPTTSTPEKASSSTMIHHKVLRLRIKGSDKTYEGYMGKPYGVSPSYRVLSPQLLLKKYDYVIDCLNNVMKLSVAQREVVLRLLRLWAYYGYVYPKESMITTNPGCSKATYWRTIAILQNIGLITVVNRYMIRPHAQISNLYRLDKLVKLIAKYLAEHIAHVWPAWFDSILHLTWPELWASLKSECAWHG